MLQWGTASISQCQTRTYICCKKQPQVSLWKDSAPPNGKTFVESDIGSGVARGFDAYGDH